MTRLFIFCFLVYGFADAFFAKQKEKKFCFSKKKLFSPPIQKKIAKKILKTVYPHPVCKPTVFLTFAIIMDDQIF